MVRACGPTGKHSCGMLKKGQTSHPPNPGAPRRAIRRARPQQLTKEGYSSLLVYVALGWPG